MNGDLSLSPQAGDVAGSPYTVTVEASDGQETSSVDVTVNVIGAGLGRVPHQRRWADAERPGR